MKNIPHLATNPTFSNWLKLATLVLFWGSSFVATKIAIVSMPAIWLVFFRAGIGALLLVAISKFSGARLPNTRAEWLWCAIIGFIGTTLPFFLISWASGLVSSASTGMMMALVPFFTLILGAIFLPQENITRERIAGLALGFGGVCLIILGRQSGGDNALTSSVWPYLALMVATLSYASNTILALRSVKMPPLTKASGSLLMSALFALIWALPTASLPVENIGGAVILNVLYLAIFPTALMTILTFSLLDSSSAAFFSLINYLVPGAAIIFGAILLNERLTNSQYIGFFLTLTGIAITQGIWRKFHRRAKS